jgi:hypothetical protein
MIYRHCFFFSFAFEYAFRKVQKNQMGWKLNRTHQLLICSDYVNLLGDNIDSIKKNTDIFIDARKEVCLEVTHRQVSVCCCLVTRMKDKSKQENSQ